MRIQRVAPAILLGAALVVDPRTATADPSPKVETTFAPKALGMEVPVITSTDDLDKYVGRLVAIRGAIRNAKPPRVVGVEVDVADELRHREAEVFAVGILGKWTLTEDQIRKGNEQAWKLGNLIGLPTPGPGTYYTLYADLTGKLAEARPVPKGGGK